MRRLALCALLAFCVIAIAAAAAAQTRKAGLWEATTTITFEEPAGAAGSPHTTMVCVAQEHLDKYGAIMPQSAGCQFVNVAKKPNGVTADMVCKGRMEGKGALEATWTDGEHTTTKVHFTGTMPVGIDIRPVVWTSNSSYVFKASDCGPLKPIDPMEPH
jgi:hypothetical protein